MSGAICPECYDGAHSQCIGQGCYCDCQLAELIDLDERALPLEEEYD